MMPVYNGEQNFDKKSKPLSTEIYGFSDAFELGSAAVVYLRITDTSHGDV